MTGTSSQAGQKSNFLKSKRASRPAPSNNAPAPTARVFHNRSGVEQAAHGAIAKLSVAELLRCRVRYFTDGAALGSSEFVQEQFEAFRKYLSEHRKSGPRHIRGGDWGGLMVLRDLRKDVIR